MARRLRLPSWVDDAQDKPAQAKPVPPLRHRISRTEKALDDLDLLEAELNRADIPYDEWEELSQIVKVKRDKLAQAKERELGIVPPKPTKEAPTRPCKAPRKRFNAYKVQGQPLLSNGVKWALCTILAAIIIF